MQFRTVVLAEQVRIQNKAEKDNSEYPPNSLYLRCIGLQRCLRETGTPDFKLFQGSLDAEMKRLTAKGLGSARNQTGRAYNGR